ncbi:MAG: hypothetical protein K5841_09905 [Fretibacterium sp.]|nr:hypothetical protein [Fretibacterium sp.]
MHTTGNLYKRTKHPSVRILVTGTRGKSSLVRLLYAGLSAAGLRVWARVTGVLPRSLSPDGIQVIRRDAPVSFQEMRWWLEQIPGDAEAIVMENSAVSPELQAAAGLWLNPSLIVWTTLRSDHEDAWGPGRLNAARALLRGIPKGVPVAAGQEVAPFRRELEARGCPVSLLAASPTASFQEENLSLAMSALKLVLKNTTTPANLDPEAGAYAMKALEPDIADFRILGNGNDLLAAAFSANDVESTAKLFRETAWTSQETMLLYHHRQDRPARLKGFLPWITSMPWRKIVFTRTSRPLLPFSLSPAVRLKWEDDIRSPDSFMAWRKGRGRIFACGNVAGWPLEYLMANGGA